MARRGSRPALRLVTLLASFTLVFVVVGARLVQLQVVQAAPLEDMGEAQRLRTMTLQAQRGAILDRDLQPLAVSADARIVVADPRSLSEADVDVAQMADLLAPILEVPRKDLLAALHKDTRYVMLAEGVRPDVAQRVLDLRLPYVSAQKQSVRLYPSGSVGGQILGFVNGEGAGGAGLEYEFDGTLRGRDGRQVIERDPQGRPIPSGRSSITEPVPGTGLVLTIDRDLQYMAELALKRGARATNAKRGTAIVLDPETGDVLAMANYPPMDPNAYGSSSLDDQRNRAVTDAYEPGSVNKVITAATAIERGIVTPRTTMTVPYTLRVADKTFHDYEYHPTQRLTYSEALARSSNVGTIKVALRVGKERLYRALRAFGMGSKTDVGFPGETPGILLAPDDWYSTSIGTIPIGQGIAASPLQVASVYATLANDGVRLQPRLVAGTVGPDGAVTPAEAAPAHRVVSAYTAAQVRGMLIGVVEGGTGTRAQIPGYLVGGKTGTARVPLTDRAGYSNRIITTFAGMAPADDPKLVVLTQLENPTPRFASLTAAPIFRQIMQYALGHRGIAPTGARADDLPLAPRRAPAPPRPAPAPSPSPSPTVEAVADAPTTRTHEKPAGAP